MSVESGFEFSQIMKKNCQFIDNHMNFIYLYNQVTFKVT